LVGPECEIAATSGDTEHAFRKNSGNLPQHSGGDYLPVRWVSKGMACIWRMATYEVRRGGRDNAAIHRPGVATAKPGYALTKPGCAKWLGRGWLRKKASSEG